MMIHRKGAKTQRVQWLIFLFSLNSLRLCAFAVDNPVDPQNAALAAFKREQIALLEAQNALAGQNADSKTLGELQKRLGEIERATGDAAQTRFSLHEHAYFAPDGSPQPFWVFLPKGYSAQKPAPLVVMLHGYSESISKINPWLPPPEWASEASRLGMILAVPYGRRNSDFVQWGEDDVLRVRSEAMAHYAVDPARVFLAGASMGGYGALAVGLHDPSLWRAVAPNSGRSDFYLWFGLNRERLPAWKRALYDADDPRFLVSNCRQTPFLIQHGTLDSTVPVEHSRRLYGDAYRAKLPLQYLEDPRGDHNFEFQLAATSRALEWFSRMPPAPPLSSLNLVAVDPREAKTGWASIEGFETYGQKATFKASIEGDTLSVATENVASLSLHPPAALWGNAKELKLSVNGALSGTFTPGAEIKWQKPGAKLQKTAARSGPFKNLLRDPFLLVYGDEADHQAAERFALEWKRSADGDAPLKSATEITDADKAGFNLILFGMRDSNPLLASIADQLPFELLPDGYRSGQAKVLRKNLGLRMVWKSPWSEARLIGVCSGQWWGEKLPLNHKWDLIPDYIIYGEKTDADDTNSALEAGFFDGNWG